MQIIKIIKHFMYKYNATKNHLKNHYLLYLYSGNYFVSDKRKVFFEGKVNVSIDKGELHVLGKLTLRHGCHINVKSGIVKLGDGVFINRYTSINSRVSISIGSDVLIGESVKFYDHNHRFRDDRPISMQGFKCNSIEIGSNVWIGSGSIILPGVKIGDNVVISALTVVDRSIPPNMIYKNGKLTEMLRDRNANK